MITVTYQDRPDLWKRLTKALDGVWPEYNIHGDSADLYWSRYFTEFPRFQIILYDQEKDQILAAGRTIPGAWDVTATGLGKGFDEAITTAFAEAEAGVAPNALCALGIEIPLQHQGKGLSQVILREMISLAASIGVGKVIVPVRPTWKDQYPLTPIDRYARWQRDDGKPFDPWIRTHVNLGGVVMSSVTQSSRITGTVKEWESWTGMRFPDDGSYVFPAGLAPLQIDHGCGGAGGGRYWEPCVWIAHDVPEVDGSSVDGSS
ncbi:N-acetyltransferase [Streptomyces sp. NPDC050636]|uniref:N-acetyltransferase n=1 Tax=Streptomyces sp. NPDC050636 TaxID=3154510 RepID=UPI003444459A